MEQGPAISVIIPTCNRPELLRVALGSLAWQSFRDFEAVVVNDGDADIEQVVAEFSGKLTISSVKHTSPRMGLSASRNTGISLSRGKYLVYLDDDDFFYKEHLEFLHKAVTASLYRVVYTDGVLAMQERIDGVYDTVARCIPLSQDFDLAVLAYKNITPVLTLIHEKACLQRSLRFAPYLRGHEDWDMWQRMGRHYPFRHIPVLTAEYIRRLGTECLSTAKRTMAESWLFVRRQGLLYSTMPTVFALEEQAAQAALIGSSSGPCQVSVILPLGQAAAFLASSSAVAAFDALCASIGDAQLILAGAGDDMPALCQRAAARLRRPLICLQNRCDVGRVLSANQAAALAKGEWLIFLEPGVEPLAGWLEALLAAAQEHPETGVLGGVVEGAPIGRFAGGKISDKGEALFNRLTPQAADSDILKVDCLTSLCLMVRREHFLALGGFNPTFAPGHYADADLCLRLKERGLSSMAVPRARLLWNRKGLPLRQTPAGLLSRRAFWDSWSTELFSLSRFTTGAEWSMRPEDSVGLWPSEGKMPTTFDLPLPTHLQ